MAGKTPFTSVDPETAAEARRQGADPPAIADSSGVDRISSLPRELLSDIVSRLPVKDAARTAVLSSRWRRIWLSAPLVLHDAHLLPKGHRWPLDPANSPATAAAVSRILEAHPGPFECVRLVCTNMAAQMDLHSCAVSSHTPVIDAIERRQEAMVQHMAAMADAVARLCDSKARLTIAEEEDLESTRAVGRGILRQVPRSSWSGAPLGLGGGLNPGSSSTTWPELIHGEGCCGIPHSNLFAQGTESMPSRTEGVKPTVKLGQADLWKDRQLRDYRRCHGLCFRCGDKDDAQRQCARRSEVYALSLEDQKIELLDDACVLVEMQDIANTQGLPLSVYPLSGSVASDTICINALVDNQVMSLLVDSGSSHSFINVAFLTHINYQSTKIPEATVTVANGEMLLCDTMVPQLSWWAQGHSLTTDMRVLPLGAYDAILGVDWLKQCGEIKCNWVTKYLIFERNGAEVTLKGTQPAEHPQHQCARKAEVHALLLEDHSAELSDDVLELVELHDLANTQALSLSVYALSGSVASDTICIHALVDNQVMLLLVDSGSSHSFINVAFLSRIKCLSTKIPEATVKVANGEMLICDTLVPQLLWWAQGHTFTTDMRVLPLGIYDGILGVDWLRQFGEIKCNWVTKSLIFERKGAEVTLKGIQPAGHEKLQDAAATTGSGASQEPLSCAAIGSAASATTGSGASLEPPASAALVDHTTRLTDDVMSDILAFVSSPAALAAAVFVCKRWRRLVSNTSFLYRCQKNPCPLIGLCYVPADVRPYQTGITKLNFINIHMSPALSTDIGEFLDSAEFNLTGLAKHGRRGLRDCHNGGILMSDAKSLIIHYPIGSSQIIIPCPDDFYYNYFTHTLLSHGADPTEFRIVSLMQNGETGKRLRPVVFDSVTGEWSFLAWADAIDVPLLEANFAQPMKCDDIIFWKISSSDLLVFSVTSLSLHKVSLPQEMSRKSFSVGLNCQGETCLVHISGSEGVDKHDHPITRPSIQTWVLFKGGQEWEWKPVSKISIHTVLKQKNGLPKQVCFVSPRLLLLYNYGGRAIGGKYFALDFKTMELEAVIPVSEQCFPFQMPWPPELLLRKRLNRNYVAFEGINSPSAPRVNHKLSNQSIAKRILSMLQVGIKSWAPSLVVKKAVIDFRSPNITKEMGIGDVRSVIIGDAIGRMLEFSNVKILRRNHVHCWPMQIRMLVQHLTKTFGDLEHIDRKTVDVERFYGTIEQRFDNDRSFCSNAKKVASQLHEREVVSHSAWRKICELTGNDFELIYKLLHLEVEEEDVSFDNPNTKKVLEALSEKGLIKESSGRQVISIEGYQDNLVESIAGTRNLASLAALWCRLNDDNADLIIYLSDVASADYYDSLSNAATIAGWLPGRKDKLPRITHVGFVSVLGEAVHGTTVPLGRLLDLSKSKSHFNLTRYLNETGQFQDWNDKEIENVSEVVGYDAVKYEELKSNGLNAYATCFDQIFNDKGNTVFYVQIAHVRLCSIIKKSMKDVDELKKSGGLYIGHPDERVLGLHLLAFKEAVNVACKNYTPGSLCDYLYHLAKLFMKLFCVDCKEDGSREESSWILLCHATAVVMRQCFYLLGITPLYKL